MQGKYGDLTVASPAVDMDDIPGFAAMPPQQQYDMTILKIASEAPIRICEHEKISGAATLGMAAQHMVPARFNNEPLWGSVSHTTLGFDRVVLEGVDIIETEIDAALATSPHNAELIGMKNAVTAMRIWHKRYINALQEQNPANTAILARVPFKPAQTFHEALQSLWFVFAFTRLCGNWSGIGRIDELLGPFLKRDMACGIQTYESARELLASFFIKGCEWIQSNPDNYGGDAQHYQNIVLAGIDKNGDDVTNDVTYLVLEIIEELGISDFPITMRINTNTPKKLLTKIADVMRHGGGVVAVYNEELIINAMVDAGYPLGEARGFANDGCWEVIIPGKTNFSYVPFDALQLLLEDTLNISSSPACFESMADLYAAFTDNLRQKISELYTDASLHYSSAENRLWPAKAPCSVVSLLTEGCANKGLSYLDGGSKYIVVSPHIGGVPDVGNSLYAIEQLVFTEKKVTFQQLMQILHNNWEGHEPLRQYVSNKIAYYGNDNDAADAYVTKVLSDFASIVSSYRDNGVIQFSPGVSTFGRQIEWAPYRAAVPFGRKRGEVLSGNLSPTPATDYNGATAIIKSYCKANHRALTCGSALDLKLHPSAIKGENGNTALVSLMEGFIKLGGFFMQIDVIDAEILKAAQQNPQDYKTLSVRVSGWNARFVTLDENWQQMIIQRTAQGL